MKLTSTSTFIIAEAGVNHNGSEKMALELVDVAASAGADAVKFQTFKTEQLVVRNAPKAKYQLETTGASESQFEMLKKLELSEKLHFKILERCKRRRIQFMSTPFDLLSLDFLVRTMKVSMLKIPSGEITNSLLILNAARSGKPMIISTGNSTLAEVEMALSVAAFGYTQGKKPSTQAFGEAYCSQRGQEALQKYVTLLHCTAEYPAPFEDVNLRAMDTLSMAFGLPVGLSDHTPGISVPVGAVARGATMIEKHFTLDKALPGPDHRASLDPDELRNMIRSIREVEMALGSARKLPAPSEMKNRSVARKSLVTSRSIKQGELFTEQNLTVKRPGTGISPLYYWEWLGREAPRNFDANEVVKP